MGPFFFASSPLYTFVISFYPFPLVSGSCSWAHLLRRSSFSLEFLAPLPWGEVQNKLYSLQSDAMKAACQLKKCYTQGIVDITPSSESPTAMVVYERAAEGTNESPSNSPSRRQNINTAELVPISFVEREGKRKVSNAILPKESLCSPIHI